MENNEELVTNVTENVEGTTEQTEGVVTEEVVETPKTYTEEELNARFISCEKVNTKVGE